MTMNLTKKEILQIPYIQYIYNTKNEKIGGEVLSRLQVEKTILPASFIFNDLRKNSFNKYINLQIKFMQNVFNNIYIEFIKEEILLFLNLHIDDFIKSSVFFQNFKKLLNNFESLNFLVLEITELSVNKKGFEKIINELKELKKKKKFKIALDDFGTETSNYEKLLLVNPDIIKIDRMFIKEYSNTFTKDIIHNVVNLCKKHNIDIVFEGIEEKETLEEIKAFLSTFGLKCEDFFQGFLFGNPVPH